VHVTELSVAEQQPSPHTGGQSPAQTHSFSPGSQTVLPQPEQMKKPGRISWSQA